MSNFYERFNVRVIWRIKIQIPVHTFSSPGWKSQRAIRTRKYFFSHNLKKETYSGADLHAGGTSYHILQQQNSEQKASEFQF